MIWVVICSKAHFDACFHRTKPHNPFFLLSFSSWALFKFDQFYARALIYHCGPSWPLVGFCIFGLLHLSQSLIPISGLLHAIMGFFVCPWVLLCIFRVICFGLRFPLKFWVATECRSGKHIVGLALISLQSNYSNSHFRKMGEFFFCGCGGLVRRICGNKILNC